MTPRPPLWQCCLQGHIGAAHQDPAGTQLWSASHAWILELHCLHIKMRPTVDELRPTKPVSLRHTSAYVELWAKVLRHAACAAGIFTHIHLILCMKQSVQHEDSRDLVVRACIEKQEAASAISVLGFHGLAPLSQ